MHLWRSQLSAPGHHSQSKMQRLAESDGVYLVDFFFFYLKVIQKDKKYVISPLTKLLRKPFSGGKCVKKEQIFQVQSWCENAHTSFFFAAYLFSSGTTQLSYMSSSRCTCCLALCFSTPDMAGDDSDLSNLILIVKIMNIKLYAVIIMIHLQSFSFLFFFLYIIVF